MKIFSFIRQLGFDYGSSQGNSHWGEVPDDFSMDELRCDGSEQYLQECPYDSQDNCSPGEGAGVWCYYNDDTKNHY